ncbi:MAG: hypothetical protein AAF492_31520, partial [Verrucomicrobiota bacterium]
TDLSNWQTTNASLIGQGGLTNQLFQLGDDERRFYRIGHEPLPLPTNAPNTDFFRPYSDFNY